MLIQIVFVLALAGALAVTWRRARQQVISRKEALLWSIVWIGAAVVVLLPKTATLVANFFGVGRGADFIIYGSVAVLFFLIFKIFVALDGLERKLTEIVRKDALQDVPKGPPEADRA